MFVTRCAAQADVDAVDTLLARAYPRLLAADYDKDVLRKALPVIGRAQPDLVTCGTYYLVEEGGQILGAGGWTQQAPGTGVIARGIGHIRHVVTDDRATRRGVASHLLRHIIETARAEDTVQLHCLSTLTAEPFYEAVGFVKVKPVSVPLGPNLNFPATDMVCSL